MSKIGKGLAVTMIILGSFLLCTLIINFWLDFLSLSQYSFSIQVLTYTVLAILPLNMLAGGIYALRYQKILKKILLTCLTSLAAATATFLFIVITSKSDVSDAPQSFGTRVTYSSNRSKNKRTKAKESSTGSWYPSVNEALKHFKETKGKREKDFFYIKALEDTIYCFYSSEGIKTFAVYTLKVKDGSYFKISNSADYFQKDFSGVPYLYDCDDAVCEHIAQEASSQ